MWRAILITLILLTGVVSAECFDSDDGKNKYEFGGVTDNSETYQDECDGDNIIEYFCSLDGVASFTMLQCVNGCEDGECQLANQMPTFQAPEDDEEDYSFYFYAMAFLIIIGLYIYWFKIRSKKRKYN